MSVVQFGWALYWSVDSLVDSREADNTGRTGRQTLERLIRDNERIKQALEVFFELHQDDTDEADVYDLFRAAAKVVRRGGKQGPRAEPGA